MTHVETLGILLSVVHNPNGSHMVDYLPGLGVEQVASAIITPVAANKKNKCYNCFGEKDYMKALITSEMSPNFYLKFILQNRPFWSFSFMMLQRKPTHE